MTQIIHLPRDIRRYKDLQAGSQDSKNFISLLKNVMDRLDTISRLNNSQEEYVLLCEQMNSLFEIFDTRYGKDFLKSRPRFAREVSTREKVFLDNLAEQYLAEQSSLWHLKERRNYLKKNINWDLIHKVCLYARSVSLDMP